MMQPKEAINDFVIKFANVNGTGSASANGMFAKAIFRMGIPVSPRNIFPSNIQGLPTWYEVRISQDGYLGRRGGIDMMVSVNPQSFAKDVDIFRKALGVHADHHVDAAAPSQIAVLADAHLVPGGKPLNI